MQTEHGIQKKKYFMAPYDLYKLLYEKGEISLGKLIQLQLFYSSFFYLVKTIETVFSFNCLPV